MNKILRFLKNPKYVFLKVDDKMFHLLDDASYIKIKYKYFFGKNINLSRPETFNEKLQWLKLYDRNPKYTKMVDKYEAKKYVADIIGEEYIIPTLGVYDKFDEIDFDKLPNQFVIKCTHDSGGLAIVKDKSKMDLEKIRKKINKCLRKNYYYNGREWPYKNVKPRIIIEKYMEDKNYKIMRDYKFFCFNGEPKLLYLSEGLENHATAGISFYDMNMELTDCKRKDYRPISYKPEKPKNFDKMKKFSAVLSRGIPHLRVDWYEIDGKLYFGELTFSTCNGMIPFEGEKWDRKLGDMIELPIIEPMCQKREWRRKK